MVHFNLLRSLLHNIGVVLVGFAIAFVGTKLDSLLRIAGFHSLVATAAGVNLVTIGFLLRVWATLLFYQQHMKVISLEPQKKLITAGPYRFSRNPLYLGGNVFIFLGAALLFGSPSGIGLTAVNIVLVDAFIRREEKQLQREFGEQWIRYRNRVGRWL